MTKTYAQLAADWMALRAEEERVRNERIAIEEQLALCFPNLPEEGQRSKRANGYLTTIKNGLYVKAVDKDLFRAAIAERVLPAEFGQVDVYETAVRKLRRQAMEQDEAALNLYSRVQGYFNITPAKPSVQVLRYE